MGTEYKKVITLNFDYKQMSNGAEEINRKMRLLDAEFKMNKESMKETADAGTLLELEIQRLNEKITLQTQKVKLEKEAWDNAKKSTELTAKEKDRAAESYAKSETYLSRLKNTLNETKDTLDNTRKETEKSEKAFADYDSKIKLVDAETKLLKETIKDQSNSTELLELNIKSLTEKIDLQSKKVKEQKEAYDAIKETGKLTESQLIKLKTEYINNEVQLEKLNNSLREAVDELKNMSDESINAEEGLNKTTSSSVDLASKMYLAKEALQAVKSAMSDFVSFDQSMSKVKTIADTTAVSFDDLKKGVYEIAKETGQAAVTISEALNDAISSNVDTKDALAVTLQAAKLAKAGFTDTATAVDILTTIMNSYNMSAEEVVAISDKLILTQDLGKTTVGELGTSFGKVAGLANQANISLDEVLAAVATLTLTNGSASESLTSLKAAISNIIKPTAEASEISKKLHLQFNATALESLGLSGFLDRVKKATNGNIETMAKLFGSTEALNSILLLTGSGADNFASNLLDISQASGNTEANLDNLKGSGNNFRDSLQNLKTTLLQVGDVLSPLIDMISFLFNVLSNIPTPIYVIIGVISSMLLVMSKWTIITKTVTTLYAGLSAVIGGVTSILGIKTATQMAAAGADTAAATAGTAAAGANVALGASGTIATSGLAPLLILILAIVVAVGLVTGAVKSLSRVFSETKNSANELMQTSSAVVDSAQYASYTSKLMGSNARGTNYFQGGKTVVGEDGPEVVEFPTGSRIYSSRESSQMMGGDTYVIENITISAKDIEDINDVFNIVKGLKTAKRRGARKRV